MVAWLKKHWWEVSFFGGCGMLLVIGVCLFALLDGELKDRAAAYSAVVATGALAATILKQLHDTREKAQERLKKSEAESAPITFKVTEAGLFLMGPPDRYGTTPRATWDQATWVRYHFTLWAFNGRPENLGITSIEIQFRQGTAVICRQTPTEESGGRNVIAPPVHAITLATKDWTAQAFAGGMPIDDREALSKCDGIFLTAASTKGEPFDVRVAECIEEMKVS